MARTTIETTEGRFFNFDAINAEQVHVRDIARSLSYSVRFRGFINRFYSIAEHALLVRTMVLDAGHPELAMAALHHDSHEAYMGDIVTPMKNWLHGAHEPLEHTLDKAIGAAFGIDPGDFHDQVIKEADELALRIEASVLKDSRGIAGAWPYRELPEVPPEFEPGQDMEVTRQRFLRAHRYELNRRTK